MSSSIKQHSGGNKKYLSSSINDLEEDYKEDEEEETESKKQKSTNLKDDEEDYEEIYRMAT